MWCYNKTKNRIFKIGCINLSSVSEVVRLKVFWSSQNGSFVFDQIFVYGTLMGVDYKPEKKI